eukprot:TRINITY_DN3541_c0_g1_i2.p1 TRINITY_DN3541_c0_g1~~TRINITY_DN3541_c0_g1_i2.p1  ORF type:complete len:438 (-),score=59.15 TRINITY_DN3541_c0_g1_i2:51-1364(-)
MSGFVDGIDYEKMGGKGLGEACAEPFRNFPTLFKRSLQEQGGSKFQLAFKWIVPGLATAFFAYVCMCLLHVATYYYVNEMIAWEKTYEVKQRATVFSNVSFSFGVHPSDASFGSLNDPVETALGFKAIKITVLDYVAAMFPCVWFVMTVLKCDLKLWAKAMVCNSLLFLMKGLLGAMTTVPDSIGWDLCKARLTPVGVEWMSQERSFGELLLSIFFGMEALGVHGTHLRWCADMVYSGHTFMNCLYALALYECTRIWLQDVKHGPQRVLPLVAVVIVVVLQQVCEIYCILVSRTHYTMDVFLAVVMTFLVYTNGVISVTAKAWAKFKVPLKDRQGQLPSSGGDVLVPICCLPFSCFGLGGRREHLFSNQELYLLIKHVKKNSHFSEEEILAELADDMRWNEGVCNKEFAEMVSPIVAKLRLHGRSQTDPFAYHPGNS